MAVDGKDFRIGITACAGLLTLLLLFCSQPSFAENTQPIRSVDLQNALCSVSQVQTNTPEAGIEFLSETQILVYTVCRGTGKPALSIHGVFRNSDNEHLRAAIFNVGSGKIEHRYDWPTQEDNSSITVTPKGHLLVVRDHVLDTIDLDGNSLAHLVVEPVVFNDSIVMAPSKVTGSITVTEMALTDKGELVMGNLVLDTETLEPLFHLASRNQPLESFFAASPKFCAGWQHVDGGAKRIVVRQSQDEDWKTIWSGTPRDLFGPYFLSPSTFLMTTDTSVMVFNDGGIVNEMKLKSASRVAISSDGKYLAMAVPEDSPSASFLPATRISVFDKEFHRVATLTNFANFGFGFALAMSPGGSELAVLSNLHVNVMKITQ